MTLKSILFLALFPIAFCISCASSKEAKNSSQVEINRDLESKIIQNSEGGDNFVVIDRMPELIGGMKAFQKSVVYPVAAKSKGESGTVKVQFIVNEEGIPEDINVIQGVSYLLDKAAINAIVNHAKFKPGMMAGNPVKVQMTMPVDFNK